MKTNLFSNLILTGMLSLSMVACQKSSGSSPTANPSPVTPAPTEPTEATVEKPKTALESKDEAEVQLATVGLKFVEETEAEDVEIYLINAKWNLSFYREFLRKTELKPTLEIQIQLLKTYCDAVDAYLEQVVTIEPQDLENESAEDILALVDHAKNESRLKLAQARMTKLEQRLSDRQKKEDSKSTEAK